MIPLTNKQISELLDIIGYYNALFISNNFGNEMLSQSDKNILTRRGIDWRKLKHDYVDYAYRFGILASSLRDKKKIKDLTFSKLKRFIAEGRFMPLTDSEKYTLNVVKQQLFKDLNNFKNQQISDIYQISVDIAQKASYQEIMKEESEKAIRQKMTQRELAKNLAEKTGDWARNFDRVANYILHSAYQHGKANELLVKRGDKVMVWFRVRPDACKHCKKTYLNQNGSPKIFLLIDVIKNGSNIGVKPDKYKASVYPLHPNCRCDLEEFVPNTEWDVNKRVFKLKRNNYGVNSKTKIKIEIDYGDD